MLSLSCDPAGFVHLTHIVTGPHPAVTPLETESAKLGLEPTVIYGLAPWLYA